VPDTWWAPYAGIAFTVEMGALELLAAGSTGCLAGSSGRAPSTARRPDGLIAEVSGPTTRPARRHRRRPLV